MSMIQQTWLAENMGVASYYNIVSITKMSVWPVVVGPNVFPKAIYKNGQNSGSQFLAAIATFSSYV